MKTAPALHPSERAARRAVLRARRIEVRRTGARRTGARGVWPIAVLALATIVTTASALAMIDERPPVRVGSPARAVAAVALASPAQGTTGTIDLPPEPAAAAFVATSGASGITAARPFTMVHASALDRGRALDCLGTAIYYEAASESDDGQRAVAQVILNRVRHHAFPPTVCGVVYQGSERRGCQFSFACDGAMARIPSRSGLSRAMGIAGAALAGQVYAPVGLATHYHTFAVTPAWNRTLVMTDAVGAHFFHRWKGYWGTAAAFARGYAGGEPRPGPHAPIAAPPVLPAPPVITASAPAPVAARTAPAAIQPRYVDSGIAQTNMAPADMLPPPSRILDRWKDSGKPLR